MQEFHDTGILRVIQPAPFGGFEADFICQIDLTYEIVRSCGASGWVCAVLSAHAAMIANFSELAQHEVWGDDPCALASSSLSSIGRFKRVDGGYLVSGFWRYSNGYDYCTWFAAGADAEEPGETGRRPCRRFLLPISALEIVDDWHVMDLAGTGSKSLRGKEVFVPEWRSLSDREFPGNTGPGRSLHGHCHLYRLSRYRIRVHCRWRWPGWASPSTRSITALPTSTGWVSDAPVRSSARRSATTSPRRRPRPTSHGC
jgi:3-hydroxy-9,10-secoandrosta-1,3,5(10)-triene-9,17-dione monooxygenase